MGCAGSGGGHCAGACRWMTCCGPGGRETKDRHLGEHLQCFYWAGKREHSVMCVTRSPKKHIYI